MTRRSLLWTTSCVLAALLASLRLSALSTPVGDAAGEQHVGRFAWTASGLEIDRPPRPGAFFDVVGRQSALLGYEDRPLEVWIYPLKVLDDFTLAFRLEGYPLDMPATSLAARIRVRPEGTILTYAHAAFTVQQLIYAPLDEPGVVMLLDVQTTLPLTITGAFRPRLRLMWPAGAMTPYVAWDAASQTYAITEETRRFAGVVGAPGARDISVMPYQEEPRDVPLRFELDVTPERAAADFIPIAFAGSVTGLDAAMDTCGRLLRSARDLYEGNVAHYERLERSTLRIRTPDARLDEAFAWAGVALDKGMAANPLVGTGLVAGFRTSGESERPGYAWFFGRDALWTALALTALGDFPAVRTALAFLQRYQGEDGKIVHEISQSAPLVPWFTDYPYAWASADATPLYIVAHADYWRASGDAEFLGASWESILRAYRFTAATDTDGNDLVQNTGIGHGWVEGGALYPPHEEIYLQGVWVEALRGLAEMAEARGDAALAASAREQAERTRAAVERTYWLPESGHYAFATAVPRETPRSAEPGPHLARRQARLDELAGAALVDEDTVLPAVPLWFRVLEPERAQAQIDRLARGAIATDWGARILSAQSALYDPLSYHYGSVWPLFTGWASMAAYRYGRPHAGFQALLANALLTRQGAAGSVTELLSGDFNTPFGRSSHHQVWSSAMVVTPLVRGLLGIDATGGGRTLSVQPRLPADWDHLEVRGLVAGLTRHDFTLHRGGGRLTIAWEQTIHGDPEQAAPARLALAPAFPLDARIRQVTVDGREARFDVQAEGDVQHAQLALDAAVGGRREIVFRYDEGSDVYVDTEAPRPGADNQGLRVIRSRAGSDGLRLLLEGRGGRTYALRLRAFRRIGQLPDGVTLERTNGDPRLLIRFDGPAEEYVQREVVVPLGNEE